MPLSSDLSSSLLKHNIFPNKKLGQCFLVSEKALKAIIQASEICVGEKVLEIGPGTGVLTEKLLKTGAIVVAVEKDIRLFEMLSKTFRKEIDAKKLHLIKGDFLNLNFPSFLKEKGFFEGEYKIIANLPYQITSPVLRVVLEKYFLPKDIILTIQKEVAKRICAKEGDMNSLGIVVQSCCQKCHIVECFPPDYFKPQPKVDSALIKIEGIKYPNNIDVKDLRNILRIGFSSRRKKLNKNLKNVFSKEIVNKIWKELRIPEDIRPQDLSLRLWKELAENLKLSIRNKG